jgi:hypothetical protein
MAEVVGILLGLPGLLTACVECANYIQLAHSFGSDYGTCLLALDATKLRLSRWGAAVGIGDDLRPDLPQLSEDEAKLARSLLEAILDTFARAETASGKVGTRLRHGMLIPGVTRSALGVYNPSTDLAAKYQTLHATMNDLAEKRQKKTSALKKAKWAFYEKGRFDAMIASVRALVDDLMTLFPPGPKFELCVQKQKELCEAELKDVVSNDDLILLREAAGDTDMVLREAADAVLQSRGFGHLVENFQLAELAVANIGDKNGPGRESKGHIVRGFVSSGNSVLNIGNNNI